jgi:hypothetical protein
MAFWAWEAVARVSRVLESCTGAVNDSLIRLQYIEREKLCGGWGAA